jgi:hypothetical protein
LSRLTAKWKAIMPSLGNPLFSPIRQRIVRRPTHKSGPSEGNKIAGLSAPPHWPARHPHSNPPHQCWNSSLPSCW